MAPVQETKVVTGKVRFCYPYVFEPRAAVEGQEPKYSICLLIPKSDTETLRKIQVAIEAAKRNGMGLWGGRVPPNLRTPLRDGDAERPDQEEFRGHYFLNATSRTRPGIVDAELRPIIDPQEVYPGCYGRASVVFYAYANAGNRGIACGLRNLQKLEDGPRLGSRSNPEEDFAFR